MAKVNDVEQVWHNDGHKIVLRINRSELEVLSVACPNIEDGGRCIDRRNNCIVSQFVYRYGMDCNGGVCPPAQEIPICWTLIGDIDDMDSCQVWFMPLTDEIFQAWLISNGIMSEPPILG